MDFMSLTVRSSAGVDVVKFEPKESYGWVFPVVMSQRYDVWFNTPSEFQVCSSPNRRCKTTKSNACAFAGVTSVARVVRVLLVVPLRVRDARALMSFVYVRVTGSVQWRLMSKPQTMRIQLSEPEYLSPQEWVMLRLNFTNKRAYYQTATAAVNGTYDVSVPMQLTRPVQATDALGTGSLGGVDPAQAAINNKTWTLVLNSVGESAAGTPLANTVQLTAAQCDVDGCLHAKVSQLPSTYSLWSNASSWPGGVVPGPGDDVTIGADMAVELDLTPPVLGNVRIEGALRFRNDSAKAFRAATIAVFGCVTCLVVLALRYLLGVTCSTLPALCNPLCNTHDDVMSSPHRPPLG